MEGINPRKMEVEESAESKPKWPSAAEARLSLTKAMDVLYCCSPEKRRKLAEGLLQDIEGVVQHPHRPDPYCPILELIAAALHGGNTSSTTTVCFEASSSTLYITSQARVIKDADLKLVPKILESIMKDNYSAFVKDFKIGKPQDARTAERRKTNAAANEKFVDVTLKNVWDSAGLKAMHAFALAEKITNFEAVNYTDLAITSDTKGNLHGEGRILRYLFMKYFDALDPSALREDLSLFKKAWRSFRNHIRAKSIFMGSSQGTCQDCAGFLNLLHVYHSGRREVVGHEGSDGWRDPLSMFVWMNRSEKFPIVPSLAVNALLICLTDDD